ncbi:MAG: hypothetical protein H6581_05210 [Bacteroidia bacterium]|nr:hypothetical protein [Bacteroidia bacterium]
MKIENPEYTISELKFEVPYLDEMEDDSVDIHFDIFSPVVTELPHLFMSLPFYFLHGFIWEQNEEVGKYIKNIRDLLPGRGPLENKVVDIMLEEGFDFEYWVKEFIDHKISIADEYKRQLSLRDPEVIKKMQEALQSLSEAAKESGRIQRIDNDLYDRLNKVCNAEILSAYPDLLNSSSDVIREIGDILHEHLNKMSSDLTELIEKAREET